MVATLLLVAATGCEGPVGPVGPVGPPGLAAPGIDATVVDVPADAVTTADTPASDVVDASNDAITPPSDAGRTDPRRVCQGCHPSLDLSTLNLSAIHNPESSRYNNNCLHCHQDILNRVTLDSRVQEIHRRMMPHVPGWRGTARNDDCAYCHRGGVDFSGNRSAGNLRRQVPMSNCSGCHSDGRWDYYLP